MATATIANSYVLVADADTYFGDRLHSDLWDDATADDQAKALIQSTRIFDTYIDFDPATDKTAPDDIDQLIKDATCEMALVLFAGDVQIKDDMEGIGQLGLKGMNITKQGRKSIIPAHVWTMIKHLGTLKSFGTIEIVRT